MKIFRFTVLFALSLFIFSGFAVAQKMKAEDVVSKHLESIGSSEDRKAIKNMVSSGLVKYTVLRQGGIGGSGKIVFASEANKSLFGMTFNIPSYPAETIVYDGKKLKTDYAINNARSTFGDYIYRYNDLFKEGLFGGTLTTTWTLYDLGARKAKIEFDGTKKIDDKEVYILSYLPKNGSDLDIKLYFDKKTFEHLRTEYRRLISAQQGTSVDNSSQQREQRQSLVEDFSDYKKENNLNLPHSYRIYLRLDGAAGTREYEYKSLFSDFYFNQPLDPNSFNTGD